MGGSYSTEEKSEFQAYCREMDRAIRDDSYFEKFKAVRDQLCEELRSHKKFAHQRRRALLRRLHQVRDQAHQAADAGKVPRAAPAQGADEDGGKVHRGLHRAKGAQPALPVGQFKPQRALSFGVRREWRSQRLRLLPPLGARVLGKVGKHVHGAEPRVLGEGASTFGRAQVADHGEVLGHSGSDRQQF